MFIHTKYGQRQSKLRHWPSDLPREPKTLHDVGLSLMLCRTVSAKWSLTAISFSRLASEFGDRKITSSDFKLAAVLVADKQLLNSLGIGVGLTFPDVTHPPCRGR